MIHDDAIRARLAYLLQDCGGQQKAREAHLRGMQSDVLDLISRRPQAAADEDDRRLRQLGSTLHEAPKRGTRQHHRANACERGGVGSSGLAIKRGDLTENFAAIGVAERKHSTVSRKYGKSDAAFHDKVHFLSRLSLAEDDLT